MNWSILNVIVSGLQSGIEIGVLLWLSMFSFFKVSILECREGGVVFSIFQTLYSFVLRLV